MSAYSLKGYDKRGGVKKMSAQARAMADAQREVNINAQRIAAQNAKLSAFIHGGGGAMARETKYFDCGINAAITTAGTTWADTEVPCDYYVTSAGSPGAYTDSCLLPTAQGTGYGQVVGQRYNLKKLRVRGNVSCAIATAQVSVGGPLNVRLLLVMDTQPIGAGGVGAQAQGEDIMQDFGEAPENAFSFQRVAAATGRFRILKDELLVLDPAVASSDGSTVTTVSTSRNAASFSFQYRPKSPLQIQIRNGNATPTVAGVQSHNIFMLAYAYNINTQAVLAVTVAAASRCYYAD